MVTKHVEYELFEKLSPSQGKSITAKETAAGCSQKATQYNK